MCHNIELVQPLDEGFSTLFDEHVSIMLLINPATNTIRYANQAAAHFYGYAQAELCGLPISQICTVAPEQMALTHQRALHKEQHHFVQEHRVAGGALHTVEIATSPLNIGGQPMLFTIVYDITKRVRAEQALRQSELRYRSLIDTLNVSLCHWLPDTTLVFTNEQ